MRSKDIVYAVILEVKINESLIIAIIVHILPNKQVPFKSSLLSIAIHPSISHDFNSQNTVKGSLDAQLICIAGLLIAGSLATLPPFQHGLPIVGQSVLLSTSLPPLAVGVIWVFLGDIVQFFFVERDGIGHVGRLHLRVLRRNVLVRKHLEFHLLGAPSPSAYTDHCACSNQDHAHDNKHDHHCYL